MALQDSGEQHRERKRSKRCRGTPTDPGKLSAEDQETTMADEVFAALRAYTINVLAILCVC